jgi:heme/copper-type cytochrome/quinol oxidase subunit 2
MVPSFSGDTNLPTKQPTQPTLAQDSKSAAEAQLSSSSSSISTKLIIAFVVVFFFICIFVLLCCCVRRHKKESSTKHILDTSVSIAIVPVLQVPSS